MLPGFTDSVRLSLRFSNRSENLYWSIAVRFSLFITVRIFIDPPWCIVLPGFTVSVGFLMFITMIHFIGPGVLCCQVLLFQLVS